MSACSGKWSPLVWGMKNWDFLSQVLSSMCYYNCALRHHLHFFSEIILIFHMNQVSHVIHGFRRLSAQAKRIERLALSPLKLAKFYATWKKMKLRFLDGSLQDKALWFQIALWFSCLTKRRSSNASSVNIWCRSLDTEMAESLPFFQIYHTFCYLPHFLRPLCVTNLWQRTGALMAGHIPTRECYSPGRRQLAHINEEHLCTYSGKQKNNSSYSSCSQVHYQKGKMWAPCHLR